MADYTTTTNTNINKTVMPDWWNQLYGGTPADPNTGTPAADGVLQRAIGASNQPMDPNTQSQVAGLTPDQIAGYIKIGQIQNGATPGLNQAYDTITQAGQGSSLAAASPYLQSATNIDTGAAGIGAADPYWGQGSGLLTQAGNTDTASSFAPYAGQASGLAYGAQSSANPYLQASTQPTGLNAAAPYLGAASQTFPGAAQSYMDPYISGVTDQIAKLGQRNLTENLLPSISDQFVRSGQFGSAQQRDVVGRALRDTNESVLGQQAQALEQGYTTAGNQFQADQSRLAGIGSTAGSLGLGQQGILQSAGTGIGSLGLNTANTISNIGQVGTTAAGADASRQLAAGQGLASIGTAAGQIGLQGAQNNAQNQLAAGATAGQLSSADYQRLLNSGVDIQNLSLAGQDQSLKMANAQIGVGNALQTQNQNVLNSDQQNALLKQGYTWDQINKLAGIGQGTAATNPAGVASSGTTTAPGPSTLSQVGGLALGATGLANSSIFKAAKGGKVVKYKRGHSYGNMPKRGLAFEAAA